MQKRTQKFVMRITNQEKQTNTYMKYSSNTAQHIRLFYTEQIDAVRISINFLIYVQVHEARSTTQWSQTVNTHQNRSYPIKTQETATEREGGLQIPLHRRWDGVLFILLNACTLLCIIHMYITRY